MAKALLIAGDSLRFLEEVRMMREFLERETEVKDITLIKTAYLSFQEFQEQLALALDRARSEPLLILFCGHGSRPKPGKKKMAGWKLSDARNVFSYYELACILQGHPAPIYIINSSCFSFGIVRELKKAGCSGRRVSVLASSAGNRFSYGGMVELVIESWRGGRPLLGMADITLKMRQVKSVRKKERFERWLGNLLHLLSEKMFLAVCDRLYDEQAIWVTIKRERSEMKRWGVILDHHFFSERCAEHGTICIPEFKAAGK